MPPYYKTSKVIDNLNNANAIELDNFDKKLDSILNQFFVDTADFSLSRWEKELAINNTYSDPALRRSKILSKLRGNGTITVNLIKNVAESFENGAVEIVENNPDYSFTVKFVGTRGIPPNLGDLKNAIEEIKPAHLAATYTFTFNTYAYVGQFTHAQLNTKTHKQIREEEPLI